jgi:hypothetical protein
MEAATMNPMTLRQIQELSGMTSGELRERYLAIFGEASRSCNKDFLRKRIAWRIQALAEGGLTERARRRAEELANDADLRLRAPADPTKYALAHVQACSTRGTVSFGRDQRLPPPGTLLSREFQGRHIVATVLDAGFEFENRKYKSLSAIAGEVTGAKWNGFVFFGLGQAMKRRVNGEK